jgi:hypothetical protein
VDDEEADGGTRFAELDPGSSTLRVEAKGFVLFTAEVQVREGDAVERVVVLSRGATVEGTVVDDAGTPVEDARLWVNPVDPDDPDADLEGSQEGRTDADGAFRVTGLPEGPADVSVRAEAHVAADGVRVRAPDTGLRLVLVRSAAVSVRVEPPRGETLPDAIFVTVTDLAGRYRFLGADHVVPTADLPATIGDLRPGPLEISVDAAGFAPARVRTDAAPGTVVAVGPVRLEAGLELRGRVRDPGGRGIAGAVVLPDERARRAVESDGTGAFVLPHLAEGTLDLVVRAEGLPETILRAQAAPGAPPLDVVLRPGGVVRGRVPVPAGEPPRRSRVCVFRAEDEHGYGPHWHADVEGDGSFALRLPAGRYRWVASRYDFGGRSVAFDIAEGGETVVELPAR